ncbi:hypothetical protein CNMCM8927_004989 [Aspergillus lentulus]|uniref:Uncharacterized protein n=1 Tax=Aspergillus lentulus TaxID=293939 RepID=A0AAN6BTE5_ASPLE|nr:hypothetical protein CNMCM8927_004989 [Aspergillus lentulus]
MHAHQSAVILYQRGIELENPCEQCEKSGTFRKCVVGPEYDSAGTTRAFFQGSCANCLWNGKSAKCDYYLSRTQGWNSDDDVTILQAGGLLRALDSGPALKDIPPKVEEIADSSAERQSKTAVLENDPFRFLLEERNDKAEEHQSTCTTHGSVDVESDSTEECPQYTRDQRMMTRNIGLAGQKNRWKVTNGTIRQDCSAHPASHAIFVETEAALSGSWMFKKKWPTACPVERYNHDLSSILQRSGLSRRSDAAAHPSPCSAEPCRHSYDYRTFMAARSEILALINQRPFTTAVSFSAKERSETATTKALFLADIQRVWEASLVLLRARESVVPADCVYQRSVKEPDHTYGLFGPALLPGQASGTLLDLAEGPPQLAPSLHDLQKPLVMAATGDAPESDDADTETETIQTHAGNCLCHMLGQPARRLGVKDLDDLSLPQRDIDRMKARITPKGRGASSSSGYVASGRGSHDFASVVPNRVFAFYVP